jgi:aminopeptidase N
VRFEGVAAPPVVSALRGFSAPVNLTTDAPAKDAYVLLAADPDLFNRWEAGQGLARDLILARAAGRPDEVGEERFAEALAAGAGRPVGRPAFKALLLACPASRPGLQAVPADPAAIHAAREALRARMAVHLAIAARPARRLQDAGEFSPDAERPAAAPCATPRSELLAADPSARQRERAKGHYDAAANMTDAMGGLNALMLIGGEPFEEGAGRLLRALAGRAAGDRQMVRPPGPHPARAPSAGCSA